MFFSYAFFRYTSSSSMIFIVFQLLCSNYLLIYSWFLQVFCGFFETFLILCLFFIIFVNWLLVIFITFWFDLLILQFFINFPQLELHLSSDFVFLIFIHHASVLNYSTYSAPTTWLWLHLFYVHPSKGPNSVTITLKLNKPNYLAWSPSNVHWMLRTSFLLLMVPLQFQINWIWIEVCWKGVIT